MSIYEENKEFVNVKGKIRSFASSCKYYGTSGDNYERYKEEIIQEIYKLDGFYKKGLLQWIKEIKYNFFYDGYKELIKELEESCHDYTDELLNDIKSYEENKKNGQIPDFKDFQEKKLMPKYIRLGENDKKKIFQNSEYNVRDVELRNFVIDKFFTTTELEDWMGVGGLPYLNNGLIKEVLKLTDSAFCEESGELKFPSKLKKFIRVDSKYWLENIIKTGKLDSILKNWDKLEIYLENKMSGLSEEVRNKKAGEYVNGVYDNASMNFNVFNDEECQIIQAIDKRYIDIIEAFYNRKVELDKNAAESINGSQYTYFTDERSKIIMGDNLDLICETRGIHIPEGIYDLEPKEIIMDNLFENEENKEEKFKELQMAIASGIYKQMLIQEVNKHFNINNIAFCTNFVYSGKWCIAYNADGLMYSRILEGASDYEQQKYRSFMGDIENLQLMKEEKKAQGQFTISDEQLKKVSNDALIEMIARMQAELKSREPKEGEVQGDE